MIDDADARRAAVLAKAKEILDRQPTFEEIVDQETRRERNRQAEVNARIDAAVAENRARREELEQPVDRPVEQPAGKWVRTAVNVTLERAEELCRKAWDAPYIRGGYGNQPSVRGNCVSKALWLQERLGGAVVGGWRAGGEPHAVLLFASEGELFIADAGKVTAIGHFEFFYDGFYNRS